MKTTKIVIIAVAFVLLGFAVSAHATERFVLAEMFTNTS